jgi:hypothetical protein
MPKKKNRSGASTKVSVGNIRNVSGKVNVAGGNITTHESLPGLSPAELRDVFIDIYKDIDRQIGSRPAVKEDLKAEVREIEETVTAAAQKKETIDEGFFSHRFRNIARMSPDILDLVVAMLANPLAGLGLAVRKIAEKAKEDVK